jgi:hypothetical protein
MANSFAYASIEKTNKNDDGTLTVYGKATDDSLDIDQQICDSDWLKKAMPEWMMSGGNVREQHSSIAAGVATEYEEKGDGHYITALVVDPSSVKKVETGVLKGFSIGIKGPRVIRDTKAAGGRIVDGQIVEISLVDRPANPNAKLILAKAVDGVLVKGGEDQPRDEAGRFASNGGASSSGVNAATGSAAVDAVRNSISEQGYTLDDVDPSIQGHLDNASSAFNSGDTKTGVEHLTRAINVAEDQNHHYTIDALRSSSEDVARAVLNSPVRQEDIYADEDKSSNSALVKGAEDQPRDEAGRFASNGGAGSSASNSANASTPLGQNIQARLGNDLDADSFNYGYPEYVSAVIDGLDEENDASTIDRLDNARTEMLDVAEHLEAGRFDEAGAGIRSIVDNISDFPGANAVSGAGADLSRVYNHLNAIVSGLKSTIPTPKDVARMVKKNADRVEPVEEVTEEAVELTEAEQVEKAAQLLNLTKTFKTELVKFDQATFDRARKELSALIVVEANEMAEEGHSEKDSIEELLDAVKHLFRWYEGEVEAGEVAGVAPEVESIMLAAEPDAAGDEDMCEKCGETMKMCKCADKATEPGDDADEEDSTEKSLDIDEATTVAIIEKAVTQAKESVKEEIGLLKSALEAERVKASQLADELATAKKAVVSGGPKRAITKATNISVDALLQKAAEYSVKASMTTDTVLAQGYRDLAEELTTKASRKDVNPNG